MSDTPEVNYDDIPVETSGEEWPDDEEGLDLEGLLDDDD